MKKTNIESKEETKEDKKVTIKEFFKHSFWVIKTYFKLFQFTAIIGSLNVVYIKIRGLFYGFLFYKIIDTLILIKNNNENLKSLYLYIFLIILDNLIYVSLQILNNYSKWILSVYRRNIFEEMIFSHLNKMSISQIENPEINNKMNTVRQFLPDIILFSDQIIFLFSNIITLISSIFLIYFLIPQIIPFVIIFGTLRFFIERKYTKKSFNFFIKNNESIRIAYMGSNNLVRPNLLAEVKISNSFDYLKNNFNIFFKRFNNNYINIINKRFLVMGTFDYFSIFSYLFFYVYLIFRFLNTASTTIGNLSFQLDIINRLFNCFDEAVNQLTRIIDSVIKNREVYEFFNIKPDNLEYKNIKLKKLENPLDINIENVSFKYPNSDKYVYENLNIKIKAGEKIAIVGENGAGKTTLSKLISGMYEVSSGKIKIGDNDINFIKPESLYRNFGILFQDYNFYSHLSVRENVIISSDKKRHKDEDVINCLKASEAWEFVKEYKNKLDQVLSETITGGIKPSTGQKQKIAIARFFYQNTPFVIFDEPTSSIDAKSEYNIFNNIYKFFKNKTVIIISHRFSTIKNADRIIVIDKGRIVEEGSHKDLMKLDGMYAKSFKMQAESYN